MNKLLGLLWHHELYTVPVPYPHLTLPTN